MGPEHRIAAKNNRQIPQYPKQEMPHCLVSTGTKSLVLITLFLCFEKIVRREQVLKMRSKVSVGQLCHELWLSF